jgi:general secretion pathway protein E
LMVMSEAARACVHPTMDEDALRRQAVADGMHPLRAAGAMKVAEGVTTLDEVFRTTPAWQVART